MRCHPLYSFNIVLSSTTINSIFWLAFLLLRGAYNLSLLWYISLRNIFNGLNIFCNGWHILYHTCNIFFVFLLPRQAYNLSFLCYISLRNIFNGLNTFCNGWHIVYHTCNIFCNACDIFCSGRDLFGIGCNIFCNTCNILGSWILFADDHFAFLLLIRCARAVLVAGALRFCCNIRVWIFRSPSCAKRSLFTDAMYVLFQIGEIENG